LEHNDVVGFHYSTEPMGDENARSGFIQ